MYVGCVLQFWMLHLLLVAVEKSLHGSVLLATRRAIRGLTNFIMHEAQLHAKKGTDPFEPEDDKK